MNIAVLLMAGNSQRINSDIPKQFININGKLIFTYTLETFLSIKEIDKIILVTSKDKFNLVNEEIKRNKFDSKKIAIIDGGKTRTESLKNAIDFLNKKVKQGDLIITHDVARVLVDKALIKNHIEAFNKNPDCLINTYIDSTDTLSKIENIHNVILDRKKIIRHQTPQSSSFKIINNVFKNNSPSYWMNKTDLCDLCLNENVEVINLKGNERNFKITTDFDLEVFQALIERKK